MLVAVAASDVCMPQIYHGTVSSRTLLSLKIQERKPLTTPINNIHPNSRINVGIVRNLFYDLTTLWLRTA